MHRSDSFVLILLSSFIQHCGLLSLSAPEDRLILLAGLTESLSVPSFDPQCRLTQMYGLTNFSCCALFCMILFSLLKLLLPASGRSLCLIRCFQQHQTWWLESVFPLTVLQHHNVVLHLNYALYWSVFRVLSLAMSGLAVGSLNLDFSFPDWLYSTVSPMVAGQFLLWLSQASLSSHEETHSRASCLTIARAKRINLQIPGPKKMVYCSATKPGFDY